MQIAVFNSTLLMKISCSVGFLGKKIGFKIYGIYS